MRRSILGVLLAAVLLTGCAANQPGQDPGKVTVPGTEQPAPAAGQPNPQTEPVKLTGPIPRITLAEQWFGEDFPGGGASIGTRTLTPGDNPAPTDDFVVNINLNPVPDVSWFKAVKVEGSAATPNEENYKAGTLWFRLAEGKAGDIVTITLPPVEGAEQTVYRFNRSATPTARLDVERNGAWEAATPNQIYPSKNLKLRLTFSSPMDRAIAEQKLKAPALSPRHPLMDKAVYNWHDENTLIIQWADAPPVINWSLVGTYDQKGLYLTGPIPAVHTGEAPYLAAVDPATGKETRLRDVMPQVTTAKQAVGGQKLLLTAYDLMGGQYAYTLPHFWLLDLKEGTTRSIDWDWQARFVESTGELKVYKRENDGRYDQGPISPDGTQWLFYRLPEKPVESGQMFEVGIEVRTPDGKLIKALEPAARVMAGKYGYGRPQAVWAPDGKSVIFTSDINRQQTELIHVDVATGASRKLATVPTFWNLYGNGPLLQWQAGRVAAGPTIVDVASGQIIRTAESLRTSEGAIASRFLSWDGKYLLHAQAGSYNGGDWGPILLVSVDSGESIDLGAGLPVGWSADGKALVIRWDAYEYRYVPQGL
jgi:hypothetical protein